MSAGNGKSVRKVYYTAYDWVKRVYYKVAEPSRTQRNRAIRDGNIINRDEEE